MLSATLIRTEVTRTKLLSFWDRSIGKSNKMAGDEYYALCSFLHWIPHKSTMGIWKWGCQAVNPKEFDCRQMAALFATQGWAWKNHSDSQTHHCGFSVWPSKLYRVSVQKCSLRGRRARAMVVRELADACKEYGLKLGIYLSPLGQKTMPDYGKPEYTHTFAINSPNSSLNYGLSTVMGSIRCQRRRNGYYAAALMKIAKLWSPPTYYEWSRWHTNEWPGQA